MKKSCKYSEYGSLEYLLFLFSQPVDQLMEPYHNIYDDACCLFHASGVFVRFVY